MLPKVDFAKGEASRAYIYIYTEVRTLGYSICFEITCGGSMCGFSKPKVDSKLPDRKVASFLKTERYVDPPKHSYCQDRKAANFLKTERHVDPYCQDRKAADFLKAEK